MNEAVTITPMYYFLMTFAELVYAMFPMIMIMAGVGFILQSVRTEPWGTSWYPPATYVGVFLVVSGFALMVML
jgi:hypothetical protein